MALRWTEKKSWSKNLILHPAAPIADVAAPHAQEEDPHLTREVVTGVPADHALTVGEEMTPDPQAATRIMAIAPGSGMMMTSMTNQDVKGSDLRSSRLLQDSR
jgi:hypothetical protein